MGVMRRTLLPAVSAVTAVVVGAGPGAGAVMGSGAGAHAPSPPEPGTSVPEADLAHHGQVSLWSGALAVRLRSENHGPSGVPDATVRLDVSVPLAAAGELPSGCLRAGERTVLCRTGTLRAAGRGPELALELRTAGSPGEVAVRIRTEWNGGATDANPGNDDHSVLVPDTGDRYAF